MKIPLTVSQISCEEKLGTDLIQRLEFGFVKDLLVYILKEVVVDDGNVESWT